jgi:hypothetical protein
MGRAAIALETANHGAGVLDRFASHVLSPDGRSDGDSAVGGPRAGSVLLEPEVQWPAVPQGEKPCWEDEDTLQQVWFQLSPTDRREFGHCFSLMILKALGLHSSVQQEVCE